MNYKEKTERLEGILVYIGLIGAFIVCIYLWIAIMRKEDFHILIRIMLTFVIGCSSLPFIAIPLSGIYWIIDHYVIRKKHFKNTEKIKVLPVEPIDNRFDILDL